MATRAFGQMLAQLECSAPQERAGIFIHEGGALTKMSQGQTATFLGSVRVSQHPRSPDICGKTLLYNASPFSADPDPKPWRLSVAGFPGNQADTTLEDVVLNFHVVCQSMQRT